MRSCNASAHGAIAFFLTTNSAVKTIVFVLFYRTRFKHNIETKCIRFTGNLNIIINACLNIIVISYILCYQLCLFIAALW